MYISSLMQSFGVETIYSFIFLIASSVFVLLSHPPDKVLL